MKEQPTKGEKMEDETIIEQSTEETEAVETQAEEEQAEEIIEEEGQEEEIEETEDSAIDQIGITIANMAERLDALEREAKRLSSTVAAFVEAGATISDSREPVPATDEVDEGFVPLEDLDFTIR